ncbi:MAG: DUF2318 domain-containing protein [Geobacter sp.]|nr:DUF2318 domain-containing protein [Geobacter sp.]
METSHTKQLTCAGIVVVVLLVAAVSVFAFSFGKYEKVKVINGTISVPVARLADENAHFFKLVDEGKEITFFVVKAPDGSIRTAFDACDSCYRSKKGYEQQGLVINCNNCNQKFAINRLGPNASGGCNPGYLPHNQNGSTITISANDLKGGAKYF